MGEKEGETIPLGIQMWFIRRTLLKNTWKNIKSHLNKSNALNLSNAMLGTLHEGFVLYKIVFTPNGICNYHNIYYQNHNKVNLMNTETLISFRKENRFFIKKKIIPLSMRRWRVICKIRLSLNIVGYPAIWPFLLWSHNIQGLVTSEMQKLAHPFDELLETFKVWALPFQKVEYIP